MKVKEGYSCDRCERGRFVVPNDWWRDVLKLVRCDWCHKTAMLIPGPLTRDGINALIPR